MQVHNVWTLHPLDFIIDTSIYDFMCTITVEMYFLIFMLKYYGYSLGFVHVIIPDNIIDSIYDNTYISDVCLKH